MNGILGVVMAGGFSSRMGTDKATLVNTEGKTWIEKQQELLLSFFQRVVISVRPGQHYPDVLPAREYITDEDIAAGPLRGIISVHRRFPTSPLFVVAVDLPYLSPETLSKLLLAFDENPEANVVVFQTNFYEPLCALYAASFLKEINESLMGNKLTGFGLQQLIGQTSHKIVITADSEDVSALRNINRPDEV